MAALSDNAQADLALADSAAVESAFSHLRRYFAMDRWLGGNNAYRADTDHRIRCDISGGGLKQKHLAEYIAASVPLHVVDGWSYLGRALQAHLIGDTSAARHLGYYAELRAAMSLLASQGIGVVNHQHFVVTSRTKVTKIRTSEGTHSMAWQALQWWAERPASSEFVSHAIRPYQRDLASWLGAVPAYAAWRPRAGDWILDLGLDLHHASADQGSRNIASYRPNRLIASHAVDPRRNAEFAIALWLSLEPTPTGFAKVDLHFLRRSFEEAFRAIEGSRPFDAPERFATRVGEFLAGNDVEEPRRALVSAFLRRQTEATDLVLARNAAINSRPSDASHHLHVISRATLLLVLASAAARRLIRAANADFSDAAFWWGLLGVDRGLWPASPAPHDSLLDYWDDIRVELDELQGWLDGGFDNVASLVANCPGSFARLSQLELVALWGMAA